MINKINVPLPQIRRIDVSDRQRFYATNEGEIKFYPSVTYFLSRAMPMDPFLKEWYKTKTSDQIDGILDYTSGFGTAYHALVEEFVLNGTLATSRIREVLPMSYKDDECDRLLKYLASYVQFMRDRSVEILCSEVPVIHPKGLAGTIDQVVRMRFDRKTVIALVDLKSGKNDYKQHAYQMKIYQEAWNATHPDWTASHCFNFHPNDWQEEPTYSLKNQTDTSTEDVEDYLRIFSRTPEAKPSAKKMMVSKISLHDDLTKIFRTVPAEDYYSTLFQ